jgi:predicted dehydrogenase
VIPVRVAVIGAGQFGRNHIRVVGQSHRCRLVAVIDPNQSSAEEALTAAAIGDCAIYPALSAFDGRVDAAVIATPTALHSEIACSLMESGVDILVEKPIASSLAEAGRMTDTARANNRILQVGHLERFNPAVTALRQAVTLPLFFEIHRLNLFSPRSLDVDVILDLMIHDIDIVLDLVGREPDDIHAAGVSILSPKVDIANVRLQFPGGCIANLTASRVSTERVRKVRLFQPHEYISLDYTRQHAVRFRVNESRQISFAELPVAKDEPLRLQWESFLDSVTTRNTPLADGVAGLRALALAESIIAKIEVHRSQVEQSLRSAGF